MTSLATTPADLDNEDLEPEPTFALWGGAHLHAPGTLLHQTRVIQVDAVIHVGTLDPAAKGPLSYEGDALSVSVHPDVWEQISETTAGPHWTVRRRDGAGLQFVW